MSNNNHVESFEPADSKKSQAKNRNNPISEAYQRQSGVSWNQSGDTKAHDSLTLTPAHSASDPIEAMLNRQPATANAAHKLDHVIAIHGGAAGTGDAANGMSKKLGRAVSNLDYLDLNAKDLASSAAWAVQGWSKWKHENPNGTMIVSTPLVQAGGSLESVAAGKSNAMFKNTAEELVKAGLGDSVIRLGWEANGDWYPWAAGKNPEAYKKAFNQAAEAMKSVPGAHFKFDWTVNAGSSGVPLSKFYPGDKNVDIIGIDSYDFDWGKANDSPQQRWQHILNQPEGLNDVRAFSQAHDKQFSVPEWGLWSKGGAAGGGGGDDPYFINQMANFFKNTPNLAYQAYFDSSSGGVGTTLEQNAKSWKVFKNDFGRR